MHGPNVSNFQEIYSLLNKYNVSNQITNLNGITNNVDKLFNNKTNSSNIKYKIKGLGDKILNSTLKEVNFFIKKNETKKT